MKKTLDRFIGFAGLVAFAVSVGFSIGTATGQQQPDPAFLQQALVAMQQQRNAALDGQAQSQAMAAVEIAKLKARIAELEKPSAPAEPAK